MKNLMYPVFFLHGDKLWYSSWIPDLGFYDTSRKISQFVFSDLNALQPDYASMSNQFYEDKTIISKQSFLAPDPDKTTAILRKGSHMINGQAAAPR